MLFSYTIFDPHQKIYPSKFKSCRPIMRTLAITFCLCVGPRFNCKSEVIILYAWDLDIFSQVFKLDDLIELSGETLTRGKDGTKHASLTLAACSLVP